MRYSRGVAASAVLLGPVMSRIELVEDLIA